VYFSAEVLARIGELFVRAVDSRNFSERYRNLRTFSLVLLNKASLQTPGPFVDAGRIRLRVNPQYTIQYHIEKLVRQQPLVGNFLCSNRHAT
jgi:hypothetical protein